MSTYKLVNYIDEIDDALTKCGACVGSGKTILPNVPCPACSGQGGRWHEAVAIVKKESDNKYKMRGLVGVTKSSLLRRRHEVCRGCKGKKEILDYYDEIGGDVLSKLIPCPHCFRDSDGLPTGAEPGTAGPWEVV